MHNERGLWQDLEDAVATPRERLAELRAAYRLPPVEDSTSARVELANLMLNGNREWSWNALVAHRQREGGTWRDLVRAKKRKRGRSNA